MAIEGVCDMSDLQERAVVVARPVFLFESDEAETCGCSVGNCRDGGRDLAGVAVLVLRPRERAEQEIFWSTLGL